MIKQIKKTARGGVLILDAGDLLLDRYITPFVSPRLRNEALSKAQVVVDAFNVMGCDGVGVGDDDLRLGAEAFTGLQKGATFPVISSNVVFKGGRKASVPYVIRKAGGLRWGIFSLLSANPFRPSSLRDWEILDPLEKGRKVAKELEKRTDFLILLAHMPLRELRGILSQLHGITIAVTGHNSSGIRRPVHVGQTIVVRSYGWGRYLGRLNLYLRDLEAPFFDEARIKILERNLASMKRRTEQGRSESGREAEAHIEAQLRESKKGNIYRNQLILLSSRIQEERRIKRLVQEFNARRETREKECSGQGKVGREGKQGRPHGEI